MMTMMPMLVSMDRVQPLLSQQGQPMAPVVSADILGMATTLLSAGVVHMRPGHAARAHCHLETDVIVLVWRSGKAGALTLYGEQLENEIWQRPGQALWIPRGVPHAALNPSLFRKIVAWEFRSSPVLNADNQLLEELEPIVTARREALTGRRVLSRRSWPWRLGHRSAAAHRGAGARSASASCVGRSRPGVV
jgi:uncharacterized RmlC-like cupin family protein